jgi:hypothetical protein
MTVQHILLVCPNWRDIRQEIGLIRQDLRWTLMTPQGATLAIRFTLKTGLLEQFQLHASEALELRMRPADEDERRVEENEEQQQKEREEEEEEKEEEEEEEEEE